MSREVGTHSAPQRCLLGIRIRVPTHPLPWDCVTILILSGKKNLFLHIVFSLSVSLFWSDVGPLPNQLPVPTYITIPGGGGLMTLHRGAVLPPGTWACLGTSVVITAGGPWHRGVGVRDAARPPLHPGRPRGE